MSLRGGVGLDYTVILCSRMDETRAFYEDVMGFSVVEDVDSWVSSRVGSTPLTLRLRGGGSICDDGPTPPGTAPVQLAFRVPLAAGDRML